MADDYYAWSPIKGGTTDKPVTIERGEKVTKGALGVSDADWDALIDAGAIRAKKFPAPKDFDGSVIDYYRSELAAAEAESAVEAEEAASELAAVEAAAEPKTDKSDKK